jgi:DNA replication and repair protein RecF
VKCLLLAAFVRVEREEMARGSTVIGPQRDDVRFMVNDAESRLYGSQGQQRSVVLSLKLAERKLLEELVEEPPLLLLDDVLSDLDDHRRQHLFDLVSHSGSQTFVTCTEVRSFPPDLLASATLWNVADGVVTRISEGAA